MGFSCAATFAISHASWLYEVARLCLGLEADNKWNQPISSLNRSRHRNIYSCSLSPGMEIGDLFWKLEALRRILWFTCLPQAGFLKTVSRLPLTLSLRPFRVLSAPVLFIPLLVYFVSQVVPSCLRPLLALTIELNENPLHLLMYQEDIHLPTLPIPLLRFGP